MFLYFSTPHDVRRHEQSYRLVMNVSKMRIACRGIKVAYALCLGPQQRYCHGSKTGWSMNSKSTSDLICSYILGLHMSLGIPNRITAMA